MPSHDPAREAVRLRQRAAIVRLSDENWVASSLCDSVESDVPRNLGQRAVTQGETSTGVLEPVGFRGYWADTGTALQEGVVAGRSRG